ncbi:hypothetical protein B0H19DRAFT_920617 [Mycena capillaripes]|nr:hypothetical protein B0H19DRAFT_920617 [Mycena capillaripes]
MKHPRFWYADGTVTVVVANTSYRLHRYLFQNSAWGWNFDIYSSYGQQQAYLGVNKKDFDRFLTILYPSEYGKYECRTAEEWASVLTVADNAKMHDIRRLAIDQLARCAGPIDKITLGHRYDVKQWLGPAYLSLAMRKEPISAAEGAKLGVDALVRVAALKDEVFANLTSYVDQGKFGELFAKMAV